MRKQTIERIRDAAKGLKPSAEQLSRTREHVRIHSQMSSQTKYPPTYLVPKTVSHGRPVNPLTALMLSGAVVSAILVTVIGSPLPGMNNLRKGMTAVLPATWLASDFGIVALEENNPELGDTLMPEALGHQPAERSEYPKTKRQNTDVEDTESRFTFDTANSRATVTKSTTTASTSPASGKRATLIETLKRIIHLSDLKETSEVETENAQKTKELPTETTTPEQSNLKGGNGKKPE